MSRYLRPDGDIDNYGSWYTSPLYSKIDEATPSDADFAVSPLNPSHLTMFSVSLLNLVGAAPNTDTGHIMRYRYKQATAGQITESNPVTVLDVNLIEPGVGLISRDTIECLTDTWQTVQHSIPAWQAQNISNYDNLVMQFSTAKTSGDKDCEVYISWAELEVPDAPKNRT